jgi:predicted SnoaL-like aldol condensation-catalyzing enzyme
VLPGVRAAPAQGTVQEANDGAVVSYYTHVFKPLPGVHVRWAAAQAAGTLVRVDSLNRGSRFICMQGGSYTYVRVDGALDGVHHVERDDGYKTTFAGCAEVLLR